MSGKSLSNGTLGLRFMQNAQRAKKVTQVEAEKAKVKDDGEWAIEKELREAWGIDSTSQSAQTVVYETSYMPFLFPSLADTVDNASTPSGPDASQPRGRRIFNNKGKKVDVGKTLDVTSIVSQADGTSSSDPVKELRRPNSISGSSTLARTIKSAKSTRDPAKTAKQVINDISGVGSDLRPPSKKAMGNVFLKPSGVDEPARVSDSKLIGGSLSTKQALDEEVLLETHSTVNGKRARETALDRLEGEGKKRRKKKKSTE